jgi:hypothetical protein
MYCSQPTVTRRLADSRAGGTVSVNELQGKYATLYYLIRHSS